MTQISIPQATSPLSMWLDYLTSIHTSAIDLGLERGVGVRARGGGFHRELGGDLEVAGGAGDGGASGGCARLRVAILRFARGSRAAASIALLRRFRARARLRARAARQGARAACVSAPHAVNYDWRGRRW